MKTQCDFCIFKHSEDQATGVNTYFIEEKYRILRSLNNSPKHPRLVSVGGANDRTETCLINSPFWENRKESYCTDRMDNTLSLETALDLREARKANREAEEANQLARDANSVARKANRVARWALAIATISAIIAIISAKNVIVAFIRSILL